MKQHHPNDTTKSISEENSSKQSIDKQQGRMTSPDTEDAARNDIQESTYGNRSYASPDFFKKKPKL